MWKRCVKFKDHKNGKEILLSKTSGGLEVFERLILKYVIGN
jgi:hypothetical protein